MFVSTFQADCVTSFLLYYATYALRDFYNVKENVAALIGNISAISGFIKLTFIFVGPINEIYGRRKPLKFAYIFQEILNSNDPLYVYEEKFVSLSKNETKMKLNRNGIVLK